VSDTVPGRHDHVAASASFDLPDKVSHRMGKQGG